MADLSRSMVVSVLVIEFAKHVNGRVCDQLVNVYRFLLQLLSETPIWVLWTCVVYVKIMTVICRLRDLQLRKCLIYELWSIIYIFVVMHLYCLDEVFVNTCIVDTSVIASSCIIWEWIHFVWLIINWWLNALIWVDLMSVWMTICNEVWTWCLQDIDWWSIDAYMWWYYIGWRSLRWLHGWLCIYSGAIVMSHVDTQGCGQVKVSGCRLSQFRHVQGT